ncbi:MAG: HNH endonuclease [Elusimicrobia bacterium]|nr:HNH endonuclease [Elusimicrobiota bacterium]
MIQHKAEYLKFLQDDPAVDDPSIKSYVSYLTTVSRFLDKDITPALLHSETNRQDIVRRLQLAEKNVHTINNLSSAMRKYVKMVQVEKFYRPLAEPSYWRISFRIGNQGERLWLDCLKRGVAVITYPSLHNIDLSRFDKYEPKVKWAKLAVSQRFSLAAIAYEMKPGDIIYVKEGPFIVAKGLITRGYQFNPSVLHRPDVTWGHHVKVDWKYTYPEGRIKYVGPTQNTVHKLTQEQVTGLEAQSKRVFLDQEHQEDVLEGRLIECHSHARVRNPKLAQFKKTQSDYRCEICGFNFEETYGNIGRGYILVHHLKPIGSRRRATKTRLEDLVVICQNCHAMLHQQRPPLSPDELHSLVVQFEKDTRLIPSVAKV